MKMEDIEKREKRIAEIQEKLKEEKLKLRKAQQLQKNKLIKQVGTKIVKDTGIQDFDSLSEFEIVRKREFQSDNNHDNLNKQLSAVANKLTWTGNKWTFPEPEKLYEWLAKFRTENSKTRV